MYTHTHQHTGRRPVPGILRLLWCPWTRLDSVVMHALAQAANLAYPEGIADASGYTMILMLSDAAYQYWNMCVMAQAAGPGSCTA